MKYLYIAGALGGILLVVRHLMARARIDQIINSAPKPDEGQQEFQTELDKLTQEIQDADIRYSNAKRKLSDDTARNPDGSPYKGTSSGPSAKSRSDQ